MTVADRGEESGMRRQPPTDADTASYTNPPPVTDKLLESVDPDDPPGRTPSPQDLLRVSVPPPRHIGRTVRFGRKRKPA
ncbi:MAG: hypothetical protein ACREXT_06320 [Gammaproteobacteria bacterium]